MEDIHHNPKVPEMDPEEDIYEHATDATDATAWDATSVGLCWIKGSLQLPFATDAWDSERV